MGGEEEMDKKCILVSQNEGIDKGGKKEQKIYTYYIHICFWNAKYEEL